MSGWRSHSGRIGVVMALAGGILIGSAAYGAVQFANAQGTSSTYYACLKSGKLTKVGTTAPTCPSSATQISWGSQGPPGPAGTAIATASVYPGTSPDFEPWGLSNFASVSNL